MHPYPQSTVQRRQRIDEVDISTPVTIYHRAAYCLDEGVPSSPTMWSRCGSSRADVTFRRPLSVFRIVPCSSVHCIQSRITVELIH
ncbi:uncharacterized protein TNCV_4433851 [Trichonephila clavipes]|nr:uncharacterized protein TNCV_4433851 [Trichonephila clavipes]